MKRFLLFGSVTCGNCKAAKMLLDKENVEYDFIDVAKNEDLVEKYGITSVPTLYDNFFSSRTTKLGDIKKYLTTIN